LRIDGCILRESCDERVLFEYGNIRSTIYHGVKYSGGRIAPGILLHKRHTYMHHLIDLSPNEQTASIVMEHSEAGGPGVSGLRKFDEICYSKRNGLGQPEDPPTIDPNSRWGGGIRILWINVKDTYRHRTGFLGFNAREKKQIEEFS
jgi:hypothetical protein